MLFTISAFPVSNWFIRQWIKKNEKQIEFHSQKWKALLIFFSSYSVLWLIVTVIPWKWTYKFWDSTFAGVLVVLRLDFGFFLPWIFAFYWVWDSLSYRFQKQTEKTFFEGFSWRKWFLLLFLIQIISLVWYYLCFVVAADLAFHLTIALIVGIWNIVFLIIQFVSAYLLSPILLKNRKREEVRQFALLGLIWSFIVMRVVFSIIGMIR